MVNRNFKALFGGGCPATDYYVKTQGCGRERFELALALAFNDREAKFWTVTKSHGLIFFWYLPEEDLKKDPAILRLSETYWEPKYIDRADGSNDYLYAMKSKEWNHEVVYNVFEEPQCLGECLDIAWNWIKEVDYPPSPQFDEYQPRYNGSGYEEYEELAPIAGFEIGTHMDRFRSIHQCEGAICYVKPSWLREY